MNFRKVIETYGYPLISKDTANKIYYYRQNPNGWAAQRFDDDSEYIKKYGKQFSISKWKFLRDSNIPISSYCCTVMKKSPVKKYEHQTGNKAIIGTMACESQNRKTAWLKHGCNSFDSVRPTSQPMGFWTEDDVLRYIKLKQNQWDFNLALCNMKVNNRSDKRQRKRARRYIVKEKRRFSIASVYGEINEDKHGKYRTTKCYRTGCVFCGFGCHLEKEPNRFQRLKQTHPKLWNYCMKPWNKGGLGMKEVLEFIGVKYE